MFLMIKCTFLTIFVTLFGQTVHAFNTLRANHLYDYETESFFLNITWNGEEENVTLNFNPKYNYFEKHCQKSSSMNVSLDHTSNKFPLMKIKYGCSYDINITDSSGWSLDFLEYTLNDTIIDNVKIDVIEKKHRYAGLNISWSKVNLSDYQKVDVFISAWVKQIDETEEGWSFLYKINELNLAVGYFVYPKCLPESIENENHPSCSTKEDKLHLNFTEYKTMLYRIRIKALDAPFQEEIFYHNVSKCVPKPFDCSCNVVDAFDIIDSTYLGENRFKISWHSIDKIPPTNISYDIIANNVLFESFSNDSSIVKLEQISPGEEYSVGVIFDGKVNSGLDCQWNASITLKAPFSPSYVSYILITGCSVIFIIVIGIIYHYKNSIVEQLKKVWTSPNNSLQQIEVFIRGEEINPFYNPLELENSERDRFEIPRNKIQIKREIDHGAFGKVFFAKMYDMEHVCEFSLVAVKQLRENASLEEMSDFRMEIDILKSIGEHPNIVQLLGYCTKQSPYLMVMELVPCGALKNYLIELRKQWERKKIQQHFFPSDMDLSCFLKKNNKMPVTVSDSSSSSYVQPDTPKSPHNRLLIPKSANSHWSSKSKDEHSPNFIQFFLTNASNRSNSTKVPSYSSPEGSPFFCLDSPANLSASEFSEEQTPAIEDFVVKPELDHRELHDFAAQISNGMAYLEKIPITHRDLAARNILITTNKRLKISDFGLSKKGPYIIRSNKPLPIRWMAIEALENTQCNSKSDVWSFGVVLWEIGTLGALPYESISNDLLLSSLKQGIRLNRPEICTDELYDLMIRCWAENPDHRPTFEQLNDILNTDKRKVYVDFQSINPSYKFPPADLKPSSTASTSS